MKESEIALTKVVPFLEQLGWSKQLITKYGRVPIKMGTSENYADLVALYIDDNHFAYPYLLVEVKNSLKNLEEIKAQANSYCKQLDVPIFAVTDGINYRYYQRNPRGGGYIEIDNLPIPSSNHRTVTEKTVFKMAFPMLSEQQITASIQHTQFQDLSKTMDSFFSLIAKDQYFRGTASYSLRQDFSWHYKSIKAIHNFVHNSDIENIEAQSFLDFFSDNIMCGRSANQIHIALDAQTDMPKIHKFLGLLKNFMASPDESLERLFNTNDELHIRGIGPFITSQFLAGAFPKEFAIIEDRMVNTMKKLKLIDVAVNPSTPKGYLYICDILKKLKTNIIEKVIEDYRTKLGFKVDEDVGLIVLHEFFWEYDGFFGYDKSMLTEVLGLEREQHKAEVEKNFQDVEFFMHR